MKQSILPALIGITTLLVSCQKETSKDLLAQQEKEQATTETTTLKKENFVALAKCSGAVSVSIQLPLDASLNQSFDTSWYPIAFTVSAGNQPICMPKTLKFISGTNWYDIPASDTAGFTLSYAITDDYMRYVDGFTAFGYLTQAARTASIERLDKNSQSTYTGYLIPAHKTARFRFTGRIAEVPGDPEAVYGHYRFALLRLPIMLKPGAPNSQWTLFDLSSMNYNLSSPTPERGHQ